MNSTVSFIRHMDERITNPTTIERDKIENILSSGNSPTIQFSKSCYTAELLQSINNLCIEFGSILEVRFYGHYSSSFDASFLQHIPNVSWLSLDCLLDIINIQALENLDNLSILSFGVYNFDDPEILNKINISKLKKFIVGENKKRNFDLNYLKNCIAIKELTVVGHTKGISVLSKLSTLETLTLSSIGKKQDLSFLNKINSLRKLVILLGGRENIFEVELPTLKEMKILRVRGLNNLHNINKFTKLERLVIEDQIKLEGITFTKGNCNIKDLRIYNCKNLKEINGMKYLSNLNKVFISTTMLDPDQFLSNNFPKSLNIFALYTGKSKKDKEIRKVLDGNGYRENSWS